MSTTASLNSARAVAAPSRIAAAVHARRIVVVCGIMFRRLLGCSELERSAEREEHEALVVVALLAQRHTELDAQGSERRQPACARPRGEPRLVPRPDVLCG